MEICPFIAALNISPETSSIAGGFIPSSKTKSSEERDIARIFFLSLQINQPPLWSNATSHITEPKISPWRFTESMGSLSIWKQWGMIRLRSFDSRHVLFGA